MSRLLVVLSMLLFCTSATAATPPAYLHYQGYLTDVEGTPVSGDWTVAFKFYAQAAGGTPFFAETRDVKPELGVFAAILGTKTDNPLNPVSFQGGEAWLELSVAPKGGVGITLQPRQRVVSHPYALWTSGAEQCKQADNALSFGGAAPTAYVTLAALPQLCITDATLAAKIEALGLEGYGDAEVAAYLLANGYVPGAGGGASNWDDLEGKPEGLLTEASAAASGLFLMADGSVVATGDLDLGGNQLLNVVIENAAAADAPAAPLAGQLWYDTDENVLKVYGDGDWISLANATNLACDGCVDDGDVSFDYALGGAKGGAALTALSLDCEGCVDEASLDISWAAGVTPGGAAADLECVGCVTLGALADGVLTAANVAYDDSATKLTATTVAGAVAKLDAGVDSLGTRVTTLENTGPGNINEGNGAVVPFVESWTMQALGKARQNFHIFNPTANPKVLLYLSSGEPEESPDLIDKTISTNYAAGAFGQLTSSAFAGTTSISVTDGTLFKKGDLVLLYQVVTSTGSPAGIWEIIQVRSVVGNTIVPVVALAKTFTHCGNDCGIAQAVRIERFKSLTVASGGLIYPSDDLSGDETRGGIVAIIADTITVKSGGRIHANSHGFEPGNGGVSYDNERGHSECNINEDSRSKSPNCSGGGGAYTECCWYSRAGGGGGGNKTAGTTGSGNSWQGQGGQAKGDGTTARLHFGGGGGYGWPSSGGVGGGIVILAAKNLAVESGGVVESNGANGGGNTNSGDYAGAGGGAGGTVAIFSSNYSSAGTVQATGGTGGDGYSNYDGGKGGDGWVLTSNALDSFLVRSIPSKVKILLDGADVTAAVGDPNGKGAPHWNNGTWGNGIDQWSTGELDLTSQGNWTLGQHSLVLKEEGGSGGVLEMALYLIYPFTASTVPENDTCAKPKVLEVMGGSAVLSDTTEDTMGRIKATDDFVQAGCGGSGGPDTVYKVELTDWRKLTIDVTASFTPRVYVRKGDCAAGSMMACGAAQTVTPDLKTGTYYLFVDGDGNLQKGNFKLEVKADPPSPAANDTCAGATTLTLDETGKAEVYGVTFFSNDNYNAGCGGTGANDLVYKVVIPNGYESMKATVETTGFVPAVYLTNVGCGANWITCAPNKVATLSWPTAGTYYIVVDGKTAADKGEFTLKVEMIAPL